MGYPISWLYTRTPRHSSRYLAFLKGESGAFAGLGDAAAWYEQVAAHWGEMAHLVPFPKRDGEGIDRARLATLARACKYLEEQAIAVVSQVVEA